MPEFIAICRYIDAENGDAEVVTILHDSDNVRLWDRVDDFRRGKAMFDAEYFHREGGEYKKGA